jgi:hypothetical protein
MSQSLAILAANRAPRKRYGHTAEAMINKTLHMCFCLCDVLRTTRPAKGLSGDCPVAYFILKAITARLQPLLGVLF